MAHQTSQIEMETYEISAPANIVQQNLLELIALGFTIRKGKQQPPQPSTKEMKVKFVLSPSSTSVQNVGLPPQPQEKSQEQPPSVRLSEKRPLTTEEQSTPIRSFGATQTSSLPPPKKRKMHIDYETPNHTSNIVRSIPFISGNCTPEEEEEDEEEEDDEEFDEDEESIDEEQEEFDDTLVSLDKQNYACQTTRNQHHLDDDTKTRKFAELFHKNNGKLYATFMEILSEYGKNYKGKDFTFRCLTKLIKQDKFFRSHYHKKSGKNAPKKELTKFLHDTKKTREENHFNNNKRKQKYVKKIRGFLKRNPDCKPITQNGIFRIGQYIEEKCGFCCIPTSWEQLLKEANLL